METRRPVAVDAEKTLIGSLLRYPEEAEDILNLPEHYFDSTKLRECFKLCREQLLLGDLNVVEVIQKKALSTYEVTQLTEMAWSATLIPMNIKALKDAAHRRALQDMATTILTKASDLTLDTIELLTEAGQHLDDAMVTEVKDPVPLIKIAESFFDNYRQGTQEKGIPTGFADVDKVFGGFFPGELTVLAARPSMGKTALAQTLSARVAKATGLPVPFFSLEMSEYQLGLRYVSTALGVGVDSLRREMVSEKLIDQKVGDVLTYLASIDVRIIDEAGMTTLDVVNLSRKLNREKGGLGMVVIDYLTLLVDSMERGGSEDLRLTGMVRRLAAMAKKLNVPVLLLAQLNREVEKRDDKRPRESDLRGSGGIEERAENILFLYRDKYYYPTSDDDSLEIIVAKQKQGPRGYTAHVNYCPETGRFADRTRREPGPQEKMWQDVCTDGQILGGAKQ